MIDQFVKQDESDITEMVGNYQLNLPKNMIFKKILVWLVLSSKDPNKTSLFIKGFLTGLIVYVIWWGGLFGLHFSSTGLGEFADILSKIAEAVLTLYALGAAAWGLGRKIWLTAKGQNETLNQF